MNEPQHLYSIHVWDGEVTWRRVAEMRELLLDELDTHADGLLLDVRQVTGIDRTGVALLIGANMRAESLARRLTLVDDAAGVVTVALRRAHVINDFRLAQEPRAPEIPSPRSGNDDRPSPGTRKSTVEKPTALPKAGTASTPARGRSPARGGLPDYGLFGHGPEYTVGVEEELMLVDADTLALVPGAPDLLRDIDDPEHIKPEVRQCMIEISSDPHSAAAELYDDLAALRRRVARTASEHSYRVAGAARTRSPPPSSRPSRTPTATTTSSLNPGSRHGGPWSSAPTSMSRCRARTRPYKSPKPS